MHARPLIVVSMLLLTSLAGCLGAEDDGAGAEIVANNNSTNNSFEIPEGRSGGAAYQETNVTEEGVGGMEHDHDYWQGRQRVTIMETTTFMEPGRLRSEVPNYGRTILRVPQPGLVFEGTGKVEITISNPQRHACMPFVTWPNEWMCTSNWDGDPFNYPAPGTTLPDPHPPSSLKLSYKHAATNEWISAGDVTWDTPFELPLTDPRQTDMPHSVASLWIFKFESDTGVDRTLIFDVTAEIVKSDSVPEWPGHPDFYADSSARKVAQATGVTEEKQEQRLGRPDGSKPIVPDKLISWGTKSLHVWVNITSVSGLGNPTGWYLQWINATGGRHLSAAFPTGETNYYFVLPVDDNGMDTPYADGSRWIFALVGQYGSCVGGCGDYRVEYDMSIVATNVELAEDEYTPER